MSDHVGGREVTMSGALERSYQHFFLRVEDGSRWRIKGDTRLLTRIERRAIRMTGRRSNGAILLDGWREERDRGGLGHAA